MPLRVIQWATGAVGSLALRQIIERPDLELVGVLVYNSDKEGVDAGELIGLPPVGVRATTDKDAIIALEADCVIHTPLAENLEELDDDVLALLSSGKNVISTAAYFAPEVRGAQILERIRAACAAGGGTTLHGSGIEPGFVFDRLAPVLSGACAEIEQVRLVEITDARLHPAAVMIQQALGIGQPLSAIDASFGFGQYFCTFFEEMVTAVGRGMDVVFDKVETGVDVIAATRDYDIAVGSVAEGTISGNRYWVNAYLGDEVFVRSDVWWITEPGVSGTPEAPERYQWEVELHGRPSWKLALATVAHIGSPVEDYDPAFLAAAAVAVNSIPAIVAAPAGPTQHPPFAPWTRSVAESVAAH